MKEKPKEKTFSPLASPRALRALEFEKVTSLIAAYTKSFEGEELTLKTLPTADVALFSRDKTLAKCAMDTLSQNEKAGVSGWPKVSGALAALKVPGFVASLEELFSLLLFSKSANKAKKDFGARENSKDNPKTSFSHSSSSKQNANTIPPHSVSKKRNAGEGFVYPPKSEQGANANFSHSSNGERNINESFAYSENNKQGAGESFPSSSSVGRGVSKHSLYSPTDEQEAGENFAYSANNGQGVNEYSPYSPNNGQRISESFLSSPAPALRLTPLEVAASLIPDLSGFEKTFSRAIKDDGTLRDTALLVKLRQRLLRLKSKATFALEEARSRARGLGALESSLTVLRGSTEALAVKAAKKAAVPGIVVGVSASGQTLFITPAAVVEVNNELTQVQSEIDEEVRRVLRELSAIANENINSLLTALTVMARLDRAFATATWGKDSECTFCASGATISLKAVRHPLVERCVPLDIFFEKNKRTLIITGANAGGKSVALKTLALSALLNQAGFCVPCDGGSSLPNFDSVLLDIGDEQSLSEHLSTYSAHLKNIAQITTRATKKSLVIMDELGSGTDNVEGSAIAMATLDLLGALGSFVAASTHQSAIKEYAQSQENCMSAAVEFVHCKKGEEKKTLPSAPLYANPIANSLQNPINKNESAEAKTSLSPASSHAKNSANNLQNFSDNDEDKKTLAPTFSQNKNTANNLQNFGSAEGGKTSDGAQSLKMTSDADAFIPINPTNAGNTEKNSASSNKDSSKDSGEKNNAGNSKGSSWGSNRDNSADSSWDSNEKNSADNNWDSSKGAGDLGGTWRPTYRLIMGSTGLSHALDVARSVGLPPSLLKKAREYLKSGGADAASLIKGLSKKISSADKKLNELRLQEAKLTEREARLQKRRERLEEWEANLKTREEVAETDFITSARKELEALVRKLREGEITREKTLAVKAFISKLGDHLEKTEDEKLFNSDKSSNSNKSNNSSNSSNSDTSDNRTYNRKSAEKTYEAFCVSDSVRLIKTGVRGVVAGFGKKGSVKVAFGSVVMEVDGKALEHFNEGGGATVSYSVEYADGKGEKPKFELRLLGMRREEAIEALERQLDLCLVHNAEYFCVIHGKGEGILKAAVKEVLDRYKKSVPGLTYEDAPSEDGGAGKTYVHLR